MLFVEIALGKNASTLLSLAKYDSGNSVLILDIVISLGLERKVVSRRNHVKTVGDRVLRCNIVNWDLG